uniref:Uncharacterized protein n=2 Tax=Jaculus jaculus TaxID=51337 RepID=A0A8C5P245_JACJA
SSQSCIRTWKINYTLSVSMIILFQMSTKEW